MLAFDPGAICARGERGDPAGAERRRRVSADQFAERVELEDAGAGVSEGHGDSSGLWYRIQARLQA
jgi:hypothetical protein